MNTGCAAVT